MAVWNEREKIFNEKKANAETTEADASQHEEPRGARASSRSTQEAGERAEEGGKREGVRKRRMTRGEDALGTGSITRELSHQAGRAFSNSGGGDGARSATRPSSTSSMTVSNSSVSTSSSSTALRNAVTSNTTTATSAAMTATITNVSTSQPTIPIISRSSTFGGSGATKSQMRVFAVIICNDCLYLEFPGCDVHGVLYTDRVVSTESKENEVGNRSRLHAKCPECTAATNNVRPFRDGCRRCKGTTTVFMWSSTLDEIAQAHEAFPAHTEEIEHTALVCDFCQSIVFPRAREVLTRRSVEEPLMTLNGKPLKVSNFQLSMPHVDGCSRKGMPVKTVAIQLPKSELKFVHDRIEKCPIAPRIQGGPQYCKRHIEVVAQQNHLHQIYLRLLTSIVKTFDSESPNAVEPLQKVLAMFGKMEPLALFSDWSPPRQLSKAIVTPTKVLSSSEFDKEHGVHRILETGHSFWRSAPPSPQKPRDEWLSVQFNTAVTLSALTLTWHPDYIPSRYFIAASTDGSSHETVAIVVDGAAETQIAFAKNQGRAISSIKISLLSTKSSSNTFGLKSITCHESMFEHLYTPSDDLLRNLQSWLLEASVSPCAEVRELALQALQHLVLASGSLCGIIHLSAGLLLNFSTSKGGAKNNQFDENEWNQVDQLSEAAQESAGRFLHQLSHNIQQLVVENDYPPAGENSLLDKRVMQEMSVFLSDGQECNAASENAQNPTAVYPFSGNGLSVNSRSPNGRANRSTGDFHVRPAIERDDGLSPFVTLSVVRPTFVTCIKRRSQLGMVLLYMISELSAWQMKRMQRAEEFAGKREEELMQLEEPFSIEVRPEFFDLSHRILSFVLSPWLSATGKHESQATRNTPGSCEEEKASEGDAGFEKARGNASGIDLYSLLKSSFAEMTAGIIEENKKSANAPSRIPSSEFEQLFTPDGMCVALLQTITSNIRRLVLSRVDPSDIGIEPVSIHNGGNFLSAPPALEPMVSSLEQLISLGAKRSDQFFTVSLKAAAAVEVGMEAFYPSAQQRTKLLTSRMGKGATLEVQVRWPVQERDQEDPRYERLILMLQFECIRMGLKHAIRGSWYFFMHLVVEVPSSEETESVLTNHFANCIQQAGFSSWQVVAGAQEISINLQRHLHWNRVEKMSHDSGAGWIRVYPRDVALFEDVLADVEHFLSSHEKRDPLKRGSSP